MVGSPPHVPPSQEATSPLCTPSRAASAPLALAVFRDEGVTNIRLDDVDVLTIGRSSQCGICVDQRGVSRRHAAVRVEPTLTLEDLGSRNGTWLDDRAVESGGSVPLAPYQLFRVGHVYMMVLRGPGLPRDATARDYAPHAAASSRALDAAVAAFAGDQYQLGSGSMRATCAELARFARGSIPVLIEGETGVGKDMCAEMLHALSPRCDAPFVAINCGALTDELFESELFGHERGAFTGAFAAKAGLIEHADGGTVFLDEVGELPTALQAKLLRVIERRSVRRVGGVASRALDVRFVAATNRELAVEVDAGRFRRDLYYRLAGAVVVVPPLRDRRADILPLAERFAASAARAGGRKVAFSPGAVEWMLSYPWPGNIRELRNAVETAALLAASGSLGVADLQRSGAADGLGRTRESLPDSIRERVGALERTRIIEALEACDGNQTRAAQLLGISRRTLINRLDTYGIPRPRKRS